MDIALAIRLTLSFAAVAVAISSLEYITYPKLLADNALANWPMSQTNRPWKLSAVFEVTIGRLFVYPNFIALMFIRLLAAVTVIIGTTLPVLPATAIIAVTTASLAMRSPYGTDGADQLTLIIFVAAALASAIGTSRAWLIFAWFVTAQACLAYFTAGSAKVISKVWRDGRALPGILGTSSYGYPALGSILARHQSMARTFGWATIILECSFPAVLLRIPPLTYALLAGAFLFHLSALFLMRLNTFFWVFLATYPCIIFCTISSG